MPKRTVEASPCYSSRGQEAAGLLTLRKAADTYHRLNQIRDSNVSPTGYATVGW